MKHKKLNDMPDSELRATLPPPPKDTGDVAWLEYMDDCARIEDRRGRHSAAAKHPFRKLNNAAFLGTINQ